MRTTTFHRIYPRLSSTSFLLLFLLAALMGFWLLISILRHGRM